MVVTAGTYNATMTQSPTNGWLLLMATFKATQGVGQTLMSNTGVATSTGRVKYRLSAGAATPAGTYTTVVTYMIYATY